MKKIASFLLLFIFSICGCLAEDLGYTINSYVVDYNIQADGRVNVTENLQIHYDEESHGFFREIPFIYEYDDNYVIETTLSNISVEGDSFQKSVKGNFTILKIGSSDKTILGDKDYIIKYTIDGAIRSYSGRQELFRNLIGTDWDTATKVASFQIHFPNNLDVLEYYAQKGILDNDEYLELLYSGNVIKNKDKLSLSANEGITIALKFPDKYFPVHEKIYKKTLRRKFMNYLDNERKIQILAYVVYGFLTIIVISILYFVYVYSKKKEDVFLKNRTMQRDTIRDLIYYDAPKGYMPWEVAVMKEMTSVTTIFAPMIYYWIGKGLVTVVEEGNRVYFKKVENIDIKQHKFHKYEKGKYFDSPEEEYWKFCFGKKDKYNPSEDLSVTKAEKLKKIADTVYNSIIERFCPSVPKWIRNQGYLMGNDISKGEHNSIILGFVISFFLTIYGLDFMLGWYSFIPLCLCFLYLFFKQIKVAIRTFIIEKYLNQKAKDVLEHIWGLKKYLLAVEDKKLDYILNKDIHYFEKILPYAIALGIGNEWIKKLFKFNEYVVNGNANLMSDIHTINNIILIVPPLIEKSLKKSYTIGKFIKSVKRETKYYNTDSGWGRSESSGGKETSSKSSGGFFGGFGGHKSSPNSSHKSSSGGFKFGGFSGRGGGGGGGKRW